MKEILQDLNKEVGVKGSMVLTKDGVVVVSEISAPLNGDQVAGVASNAIKDTNASLKAIGASAFSRFVLNSTYGKLIFVETGDAYLVVVLDKQINIDFTMLAVASAARKIKMLGSLN